MRAFFFGCWQQSGHFMFVPGGQSAYHAGFGAEERKLERVNGRHIDGSLAPKWVKGVRDSITFKAKEGLTEDDLSRIEYRLDEMPQGYYLIHHAHGYTYMSWWDRNQGDSRGACNSTFILEGTHDAVKMFDELVVSFPQVVENLRKANIPLHQVVLP